MSSHHKGRAREREEGAPGSRRETPPHKIVADIASQHDLNSRTTRQLQLWTDSLVEAIRQHQRRQQRRLEGFAALVNEVRQ